MNPKNTRQFLNTIISLLLMLLPLPIISNKEDRLLLLTLFLTCTLATVGIFMKRERTKITDSIPFYLLFWLGFFGYIYIYSIWDPTQFYRSWSMRFIVPFLLSTLLTLVCKAIITLARPETGISE
jgi:hypothetical protein